LAVTVGFGAVSGIIMSAFIKPDVKAAESGEKQGCRKIEKQEG